MATTTSGAAGAKKAASGVGRDTARGATIYNITIELIEQYFPELQKYRKLGIPVEDIMWGIFVTESGLGKDILGNYVGDSNKYRKAFDAQPKVSTWNKKNFGTFPYYEMHTAHGIGQVMGWHLIKDQDFHKQIWSKYSALDAKYNISVNLGDAIQAQFTSGASGGPRGEFDTLGLRRGIAASLAVFAEKESSQKKALGAGASPEAVLQRAVKGYLGSLNGSTDVNGTNGTQYLASVIRNMKKPNFADASTSTSPKNTATDSDRRNAMLANSGSDKFKACPT